MKLREAVYVLVALGLVVIYASLGSRVAPLLVPAASPTPTPTKPVERVEAPRVSGTIAFVLRGDVYVLSGGGYVPLTSEGRSLQPNVSTDGKTVVFSRTEQIDGRRVVDGQVVPALLRFTNIVRKDAAGGPETVVVSGLVRAQSGFHEVTWFNAPALSPDGKRIAVTFDVGDGVSDLALYDAQSGRRMTTLSQGSNLSDPAWSPDGKTIAVTSYTLGAPRLLPVAADGRAANPLKIVPNGEPSRPARSSSGDRCVRSPPAKRSCARAIPPTRCRSSSRAGCASSAPARAARARSSSPSSAPTRSSARSASWTAALGPRPSRRSRRRGRSSFIAP